jgi:ABC-type bacteriocin/lantibiotic exporter with double-glycine peptidase domain
LIGGRYVSAEGAILQKGAVDCGVAAMKMLVASYGYAPSRLDALDDSIVARRRGMSMLEIQRALAGLGVVTEGRQMNLAALAHVRLPVIAHAPDHFIVIDEMRPDGLWDIRDPAIGRVRMDASALARRWDGKVLVVTGRRAAAR